MPELPMSDPTLLRELVSDGASVRRIEEHIRARLKEHGPGANVVIEYSTMSEWTAVIEVPTGATLTVGCGLVYNAEPIDTLVRLLDEIDKAIDHYWELNKEEDDGN